jgi:hypothetical protein
MADGKREIRVPSGWHSEVGFLRPQALAFSPTAHPHPHAGGRGAGRRLAVALVLLAAVVQG